jgi:polar amino acid transport system substrate-binding protein
MGLMTGSRCHLQARALRYLTLGACLGLLPPVAASPVHYVDVYLAEAPPLSMLDHDTRHGMVGDIVFKAATLAGYTLRPQSPPWLRGQRMVRLGTDQLILPLSRTPDREDQYTWIAPIMGMDRAFFSLERRVETFAQARLAYSRIAVGMGSAQQQKLKDEGFRDEQVYPLKIGENPAQMLRMGRVDAWFNGIPETRYIWQEVSDRPLLMSPALMSTDLYLACSKRCDPQLVDKLRAAIETLRQQGGVARIIDDYVEEMRVKGAPGQTQAFGVHPAKVD